MSSLITELIVKPSQGTAAAWTSENPTLEAGEVDVLTRNAMSPMIHEVSRLEDAGFTVAWRKDAYFAARFSAACGAADRLWVQRFGGAYHKRLSPSLCKGI